MFDDVDDARHNPTVIDLGDAMRQRKKRLDPTHLRLTQQKQDIHWQRLLDPAVESTKRIPRKQFNRS
jgi:hypothetical protein